MKTTLKRVLASAALLGATGAVSAGVIDPYLNADGTNVLEDDSGEAVLRANETGGYDFVTSGSIREGDILVGFLDYSIINGVNIDSGGEELSSIFMVEIETRVDQLQDGCATPAITPSGTAACEALGGQSYAATDLIFDSVDASLWNEIFGIDIAALEASLGADLTGATQLFYDDDKNNVDIFFDSFDEVLANTLDGELRFVIGEGPDSVMSAQDAPVLIEAFLNPNLIGGVSEFGTFSYKNDFLWDDLAGDQTKFFGSGFNLANSTQGFGIQNDAQGTFVSESEAPAPATLLLMGLGLLGMGASRRK